MIVERLDASPGRLVENPYGYFDPTSKAFVVENLLTPRPWVNVLSNDRYGLVVSQVGGGFSWFENCQVFRITRWEQDLVRDEMGRFCYVLDLERPNELWSTTYQPTRRKAGVDRAIHGLGYTTFERRFLGMETRHTVFVPLHLDAEIWLIEIRNISNEPRRLRLAAYHELHLGGIGDWHREFHRLFMESGRESGRLVAWKHPNLREHRREELETPIYTAFGWNGGTAPRWVTDKATWLGPCGTPTEPRGLIGDAEPSETPRWDDPIAAGMIDVDLAPGETRSVVHVVSASRDRAAALSALDACAPAEAERMLREVREQWLSRCSLGKVRTDGPAADLMVNAWLPYQAIAGRLYARCAYYQQGGAYGYRDQLQDSLMLLDTEPDKTLEQIGRHAEAMYEDGGVRHWWHPNTDIFVESRHSDTCLWLAYATLEYLDATADDLALGHSLRYLNRETQAFGESGALLDHCLRGIDRALGLRSSRGLPLIGAGDWNDGLSHAGLEGRGESVWVGMFLFGILERIVPVLRSQGFENRADVYAAEAEELRAAVNEHGWDGEWYLEGTRDDGRTLGSHRDAEGSIFLNPQTWAVLTGIAPPERAQKAMDSVRQRLLTPYGALLLQPAFKHVDQYVGYISRYAPGLRENGGVYSHASVWAVLAFLKMGDRETAVSLFRSMLPPVRSAEDADLYAAEPYVMPGNADGPDSPYAGRAGWTWYTGSAAWMVRAARALAEASNAEC